MKRFRIVVTNESEAIMCTCVIKLAKRLDHESKSSAGVTMCVLRNERNHVKGTNDMSWLHCEHAKTM